MHFNGHIDVVEVGHGWTLDPFAGIVRDGRVYGRGACDMKGGIAASMIAAAAIAIAAPEHAGAIEVSGTADEESGGFGGVGYLARNGWFDRGRVDHVIIPEPLGVDRVCLGHRGVWWSEITMKGHIGHGAMPYLGVNAIRGIGEFVSLIEDELMPKLEERVTRMRAGPRARVARRSISIPSMTASPSRAMVWPAPVVAESARIVIDRRYLIEEDPQEVRAEILSLAERAAARFPGMSMEWRELMSFVPTMTEPDAPVVQALDHAIHKVLDRASTHIASPGTYDQKHIARFGSVMDCVAYGPGVLDLAHQPDEWVGIDDADRLCKDHGRRRTVVDRHAGRPMASPTARCPYGIRTRRSREFLGGRSAGAGKRRPRMVRSALLAATIVATSFGVTTSAALAQDK